MNAAALYCMLPPQQQRQPGADTESYGVVDEDDSGSDDDVIDVLSADHCTGEHSYTMQMPDSMRLEEERRASESPELEAARRLVEWLGSPACRKYAAPFLEPADAEQRPAYLRVVRQPMCLRRVREGLDSRAYPGITEVVRDLRLILENCYRFYGPQHHLTKKALKLETVLEQKLALLPRELREKTSLEATTLENRDVGTQRAGRRARLTSQMPTGGENSALLQLVKAEKAAQAREERLKQREERRVEKEVAQQAAIDWENATFGSGLAELAQRWEVPQVCQFLRLSQEPLQLPDISVAEVERSLLMPDKSSLLALLMTCLLVAPQQRPKTLLQHPMPYRVWNDRLRSRLQNWYRTFLGGQRSPLKVFEAHGLEEQFFVVMGDTDPMESIDYHQLSLLQRLWLLKGLCDHKLGQHRRVQEWMAEQEADSLREACLGEDHLGRRYLHFPCLGEPRLYRTAAAPPPPPEEEETREPTPPPQPPKSTHKSKKKGRQLRSSSRKSSRHRKAKAFTAEAIKEENEDEEEKVEKVVVKEEPVDVEPPAPMEVSPEVKEEEEEKPKEEEEDQKPLPEFETLATSVADLRTLIASLAESTADKAAGDTKRGKAAEVAVDPQQSLLDQLRALLAEWEPQEARFLQADAALRTRLHREWHQPDSTDGEDAMDSWTMHYKDEECTDDESSSGESVIQDDNGEDQEDVDMQEDNGDATGWRVLRKRKIALPNGLSNCSEEAGESFEQPSSSQVSSASSSQPTQYTSSQTVSQSSAPPPQRLASTICREPATKTPVPLILARSTTPATLSNVMPSSSTWIRPFAKLRTYGDIPRRPTKVRSLLEAGITTFSNPSRPPTSQTSAQSQAAQAQAAQAQAQAAQAQAAQAQAAQAQAAQAQAAQAQAAQAQAAQAQAAQAQAAQAQAAQAQAAQAQAAQAPSVTPPPANQEPVVIPEQPQIVQLAQEGAAEVPALPVPNDVVMEDSCNQEQDQRPSSKAVLVPAVDNSGQEILLHVEYTTLDEATLGNNLQSLPLPTAPPVGQNFPAMAPASQALAPAPVVQNLQVTSSQVVQNVSMMSPVMQSIPTAPALVQTLPTTSSTVQPNTSVSTSFLQNHRRETASSRNRVMPWWRHSNTPETVKAKEVPPLAPITTPRKIFKSRNMAVVPNQLCPTTDGVNAVSDGVRVARSEAFVSPQHHQQVVGSNGSQQLVFVVPPSPPKQQVVLQQQPEAPAVSQDLIGQLIPITSAPSTDDQQQATVLLQTALQNTMQTPLLLLTSDGHLIQVVQQPS
ncbi:hypothetical protein V5799_023863 [Amblyomma americanum]|uniref:Bromo domain-containing protein n=1 Tax=Amblyomma americanum TaxID=6943 RepID=A0AAQ4FGC1_AMBAM